MQIELQITKIESQIVWERVVNTLMSELPKDYPYWDDVFELKELCSKIDAELRKR